MLLVHYGVAGERTGAHSLSQRRLELREFVINFESLSLFLLSVLFDFDEFPTEEMTSDDKTPQDHFILGKSASFVCENVLYFPEFFIESGRTDIARTVY